VYYLSLPGLVIAIAIATPVAAAKSAHVHGRGQVNIAIEDDRVYLALASPGADIVGFEYAPRNSAQKAAVAAALDKFGDPAELLRFTPAADCRLIRASAELESDDDEHEKHGANEDEHEHEHEHEAHPQDDDHGSEESHGAFVAEYEFACSQIDALTEIEFTYFAHFGNAQTLEIVLIDGHGQRREDIGRAEPVLRLAQ
jgi:hypothetical protein